MRKMCDPEFIGDWYRERRLGTGGFGTVVLWRNKKTEERVAIKKCHEIPPNELNDKQKERWIREVQYMENEINNENIVKSVKIEPATFVDELTKTSPQQMPILVMEYCDGGDLRQLLNASVNVCGLKEYEIRDILRSIGNAISYLHQLKITHRDIKPENIVIKCDGSDKRIYKLTDLGYAKGLDFHSLQASCVGTTGYVAPELFQSDKYSCTVDYWSFGVIAFEIITGLRPFVPHMPLVPWFIALKQKKSEHICVTEDQNGLKYKTGLFKENHISITFAHNMEKWFRLALEWNPKQRGYVFEMPSNCESKTVSFADDKPSAPVQVLKIFSLLNDILAKKILHIFCLQTYQELSYEITEYTTMDWLISNIEKDTKIPKDKIQLTMSLEYRPVDRQMDKQMKPIDFYLADYYEPMLYISKRDISLNLSDIKSDKPKIVEHILENPKTKLMPNLFKRFCNSTLFFIRREQRKYMEYLRGFRAYSVHLNEDIINHEVDVNRMTKLIYGLDGALKLYEATLAETQNELGANYPVFLKTNWLEQQQKLAANVEKITNAGDKIQRRYRSALGRSNKSLMYKSVSNCDQKTDFFSIKSVENSFEIIRAQLAQKCQLENKELYERIIQCENARNKLLHDKEFKEWRENISRINIEIIEIKRAIEMAILQGEKYREEILAANSSLQKAIRSHIKVTHSASGAELIPDIDAIFNEKSNVVDFQIGEGITPKMFCEKYGNDSLCFGEGNDTVSLIEANENLLLTFGGLINDIDKEMSDTSSKT